MIPAEVTVEAKVTGYVSAEELVLRNGETIYLLIADGGKVGVPQYLHYVDGLLMQSTNAESMALFDEPAFMDEG